MAIQARTRTAVRKNVCFGDKRWIQGRGVFREPFGVTGLQLATKQTIPRQKPHISPRCC